MVEAAGCYQCWVQINFFFQLNFNGQLKFILNILKINKFVFTIQKKTSQMSLIFIDKHSGVTGY